MSVKPESLTETEEKRTLRQILHEKLTEHTEKYAGTNTFTLGLLIED